MGLVVDSRLVEAYEKNAADLIGYATALVGADAAEDVVGDTIVRVIRTVDWDRVVDPRAYLYRCVLNEVRRRSRRKRLPLQSWRSVTSDGGVAVSVDELGVFRHLSARERAVTFLAYWEDATIPEIAAILGISDGSVRRYLARARAKLRKELSDEHP